MSEATERRDFEYGTDGPKLVVAGLDGSRTAWRAVAYAAGVARRSGSQLVVVHVSSVGGGLAGLTPQAAQLSTQAEHEYADQLRAEVEAAAQRAGQQVSFEIRDGEPAHAIEAAADEHQADAVVVGGSESPGHRLLGSTAVRLVRAGKWPVTVVP